MRRIIKLTLFFVALFTLKSFGRQKIILSEESEISVITCDIGKELYSSFGHTALRVKDEKNKLDVVFNYGSFDFSTSNFYLKFSRGSLNYYLTVTTYDKFIREYTYTDRSLFEQILDLTVQEKNKLFTVLSENIKPQNRFYRYQFFKDNCTTRIRDFIQKVTYSNLVQDSSYIEESKSYRTLFTGYLKKGSWVDIGLNLCLGLPADHKTTFDESLFLPFELEKALDHSYLNGHPLVKEKRVLYSSRAGAFMNASKKQETFNPFILLTLLSVILGGLAFNQNYAPKVDVLVFGVSALVGLILFYLAVFSLHTPTHYNLNLLWLSPFNLILITKKEKFKKMYCKLYLILLALVFIINSIVGYFNPIFFPITIVLMVRLSTLSGWLYYPRLEGKSVTY
ncbi:DUF4105 domain-containing protein [Flammeovirga sp. SJP92]|uniref:lipoprotein N-acyltransferase Lnb domain-containing protein n=1 Tax=Flammeovirga sp. SJP92 TaxID=1775430 RepID=UPI0007886922|nr:DUF4105 domain-containing protein [Flammeovirga sp. SJP92]KXX67555.1 hypothetical protein AVL50_26190 [Flammeovirga sp. SJP92]